MTPPPKRKRSPDTRTGDRHKGTPGVLVRAPAAEIEEWRGEASAEGMTLTRWIRDVLGSAVFAARVDRALEADLAAAIDLCAGPRPPVWADAPCDCGRGKRGHACPPHKTTQAPQGG